MQALNVLSQAGVLKGEACVRLLTNRAACLLALHQPLRALQDCQHAVQVSVQHNESYAFVLHHCALFGAVNVAILPTFTC